MHWFTIFHDAVHNLFLDLSKLEEKTIVFVILLTISVIVVDGVLLSIEKLRKTAGFDKDLKAIAVDKGKIVASKRYLSETQQLAGSPDAVIEENGFFIPVERKPFAKNIHERYIAQLLVYMRLVEEFEGKRPPYGYLILGKKCKKVKIENSEARQQWLTKLLREMHTALQTNRVKPAPHPKKCAMCPVASHCTHRFPIRKGTQTAQ